MRQILVAFGLENAVDKQYSSMSSILRFFSPSALASDVDLESSSFAFEDASPLDLRLSSFKRL